ncbi:hypothetical protein Efla_003396 [Eimeria flavescens]
MDRLNRIIRELESEDLSPMNSRGSFFAREGAALAVPRPSGPTRFVFSVSCFCCRVNVLPDEDASARCLDRARFCSRGATRTRASEADSGKSEEATATLTSERDDFKHKLRDEAKRLRKESEHLRQHEPKTFEEESVAKTRNMERLKQERKERAGEEELKRLAGNNRKLRAGLNRQKIQIRNLQAEAEASRRCKAECAQLWNLAVIDTLREEVTEWECRALESYDRKRRASTRSTPSLASPAADTEDTQGTHHASSSQAGTSHFLPCQSCMGKVVKFPILSDPMSSALWVPPCPIGYP